MLRLKVFSQICLQYRSASTENSSACTRIDYMISRFNRGPTDPFLAAYDDTGGFKSISVFFLKHAQRRERLISDSVIYTYAYQHVSVSMSAYSYQQQYC